MFGQGVNLAMNSVTSGKLPNEILMYGIVVAFNKPHDARLLTADMNLETGKCTFSRGLELFKLLILINRIIDFLHA